MKQPIALLLPVLFAAASFAADEATKSQPNQPSSAAAPVSESSPAAEPTTPPALALSPAVTFTDAQLFEFWGWTLAKRMQLGMLGFTAEEMDSFNLGMKNGVLGSDPIAQPEQIGQQLRQLIEQRGARAQALVSENNRKANEAFFAGLKTNRPNVIELPSGLRYEIISEGTGPQPAADQIVVVHYEGTLINGRSFDSSIKRGQPAEFALAGVIPGFSEGLKLLKKGTRAILYIPPQLGYGDEGAGEDIPANALLIFEVELLDIKDAPKPVEATTPPVSAPTP